MSLTFDEASHSYMLDGVRVPSVTQVISMIHDPEFEMLKATRPDVLAAAADRGTRVHSYCEFFDNGVLDEASPDFDEEVRPYLSGWKQFVSDTKFLPIHNEEQVWHGKLRFAGTLDRMGEVNGDLAIVDIKTGSVIKPTVGLQLKAYEEALKDRHPEYAKTQFRRYAVQLKPDGTYRLHQFSDSLDWVAFVSCLNLYNWRSKHAGH